MLLAAWLRHHNRFCVPDRVFHGALAPELRMRSGKNPHSLTPCHVRARYTPTFEPTAEQDKTDMVLRLSSHAGCGEHQVQWRHQKHLFGNPAREATWGRSTAPAQLISSMRRDWSTNSPFLFYRQRDRNPKRTTSRF